MRHQSGSPLLRIGVAAMLLALLAGCQSDEAKLADFLEQGHQFAESDQPKEAIIAYRNVLKIDPNHAEAHYELAKSYLKTRQLKEAYWELQESVRLDPANIDARLALGQFSLAAREFDEALAQGEAVAEARPEMPAAYLLQGQALEGLDRAEEAEAAYKKAVEVAPEKGAELLVLASYYRRHDRPDEAEPLLVEFTEVDPGYVSYTALARHLVRDRERDDEAEEAFRKALDAAVEEAAAADAETGAEAEEAESAEPGIEEIEAVTSEQGDRRGSPHRRLVDAHKNLAGFYYARARFDEAREVLRKGIERSGDDLELIYLLARFHRAQGEEEEADALIERATKARPDDPRPYLVLSTYREQKGDLEGALEAAEAALEADPENKAARLRKAELLVDMGYRQKDPATIAKGRSIVDAMLAKEPSNPEGLFVRAKIAMAEEDVDTAVSSLRAAIDGRPDWADAHFVLGSALILRGDAGGARAELARALELDPGMVEARRLLARVHAALGEHEYAIEQGRAYLRERPDHQPTRILVAQSLVRLGKMDEAFSVLQEVPEEERTSETVYAIGRLYMNQGKPEKARELLLEANEMEPNHPDILRSLHQVEIALGNAEASAQRIAKAVEAKPDNARLRLLQAGVDLSLGRLEEAEKGYKRAIELAPTDVAAYEQLSRFYTATGRVDETIETYLRALEVHPRDARLHYFVAALYEATGDRDKAIEHYEKSIENDASLGEAKNNLAYLLAERGESLDRALDLAQEAKALLPDSPNAADTLGWVLFKRGVPSAAVGYLREAVAGMDPAAGELGVMRHHLAQAYEANGEPEKAIESWEKALGDLEQRKQEVEAAGNQVSEPAWAVEARQMMNGLKSQQTG